LINEQITRKVQSPLTAQDSIETSDSKPTQQGKLILDATCAPEDVRYPTDIALLNDARVITEKVIDVLWQIDPDRFTEKKPRTYRKTARKMFLNQVRQKRSGSRKLYKSLKTQLQFISRNLDTIDKLKLKVTLGILVKPGLYKKLLTTSEVYRQQSELLKSFGTPEHNVPNRIISIHKPHVRPIVRGKVATPTEFGAKVSLSVVEGMVFLDRLSWDAYNEGLDLIDQAEVYRKRKGYYPESIHADKIYMNQINRKWCKERSIRLSGKPLGRPQGDSNKTRAEKRQLRADEITRIEVEGKFGVAKRKYSLSKVMMRLSCTSETTIALVFLIMNLEKLLRAALIFCYFCMYRKIQGVKQRLLGALVATNQWLDENLSEIQELKLQIKLRVVQ
jgi:hypothetical protein